MERDERFLINVKLFGALLSKDGPFSGGNLWNVGHVLINDLCVHFELNIYVLFGHSFNGIDRHANLIFEIYYYYRFREVTNV